MSDSGFGAPALPAVGEAIHLVMPGAPGGEFPPTCVVVQVYSVGGYVEVVISLAGEPRVARRAWDEHCVRVDFHSLNPLKTRLTPGLISFAMDGRVGSWHRPGHACSRIGMVVLTGMPAG